MKAIIFATLADAQAHADKMAANAGMPWPGCDVGGGRHAPPDVTRTLRMIEVTPSKTAETALVLDDATVVTSTDAPRALGEATVTVAQDGAVTWGAKTALPIAVADVGVGGAEEIIP